MNKKETYKFEILKKDNYHIYYEDRDDNAGGAIFYKNLKNNEFFEQSVKIENLIDFYNACELCVINFYHLLPFSKDKNDKNKHILLTDIKSLHADLNKKDSSPENQAQSDTTTSVILSDSEEFKVKSVGAEPSVYRHSDTLPMGEGGKGESGISPLQDKIDTFKLEAEHQAATAIVEANMAEFEAERQEIKEKEREEREALIAEASKLTGRVEAFNFISKLTTVGGLTTLKKIKESGVYKELPNIKTWEEYCNSLGFSRTKVDEDLNNLNIFGEDFLTTVGTFGLGYRELRSLSKQVKSGSLEVRDAEVIIDGEVIPLDDKDELRDALDTLLKSKYKEIEEKDKELESVRIVKDKFATDYKKASDKIDILEKEVKNLRDNKPSFKNVSEADAEDFQKLLNLEQQWRDLFNALNNATNDNSTLSNFNKSMLGGIIAQILLMLDDFRMQLNGKSEFYFHGVEMDEEMLNSQVGPSDYLAMQNEK